MKCLILLLLFLPMQLFASRSYDVELVIRDELSGERLANSKVEVVELDLEFITDSIGSVHIANCRLKSFTVRISREDYYTCVLDIERDRGRTVRRTIQLVPNSSLLKSHFEKLYAEEMQRFEQKIATIDTMLIPRCDSLQFPNEYSWDAHFPGGEYEMKKFLAYSLIYPIEAIELGEQGKVYVSFVIEHDGSVVDIEIVRGVSKELDREAKRIIASMPSWIPSYCNGRPVKTKVMYPMIFELF